MKAQLWLIHWGELQISPVGKNAEDQNHSPDDDLRYLRYPGHNQTVHPFMLQEKRSDIHEAFLDLACALILLKRPPKAPWRSDWVTELSLLCLRHPFRAFR
jgi:hypothetical protein